MTTRRRELLVPQDVANAARLNCDIASISAPTYVHMAHDLLINLLRRGISGHTSFKAGSKQYPLPKLSPTVAGITYYDRMPMVIQPHVIQESASFRDQYGVSLSGHVTRALRLLNYAFEVQTGNPIEVTDTGQGELLIVAPFTIPKAG